MNAPHKQTYNLPMEEAEDILYAKHKKIYPRKTRGLFNVLKKVSVIILLGIFYVVPWIQWKEGHQAVLFDLPARQFHLFGLTFWPQDLIYLTFLLIIAGFTLFFFTAIAGRLWCGFACPQTVWTDVFIWIERWVEGDRAQRIKLDKGPWTDRKIRLKVIKHTLWIVFSFYTGYTFLGYFVPIREIHNNLGGWSTFWLLFYGLATYANAGMMREQICIYMCPYARFQSAMFDKDTLIIAYDEKRGEPRGSRKRQEDYKARGLGDCINCTLCVQVCPTGIDIRKGLQYQCISCSACIDACDEIMDKMGYPRGLVRYTTENALQGKPTHVFRPRIFVYATILLALMGSLIYTINQRVPVQLDVIRDRNTLFKETETGFIENVYTLKLMNKDEAPHTYILSVTGIEGLQLLKQGDPKIAVEAGKVADVGVRLIADPSKLTKRSSKIVFHVTAHDNPAITSKTEARFLGPVESH